MTPLAIRRRLQEEKAIAETACTRARAVRSLLVDAIMKLDVLLGRKLDRDTTAFFEARRLQQTLELTRFDRDVAVPAEELRVIAIARLVQFETELEMERKVSMRLQRHGRLKRKSKRKPLGYRRPRKERTRVLRTFLTLPN